MQRGRGGRRDDRCRSRGGTRTGTERAPSAIKAILTAPGFETAEGRLIAEIEADEPEVEPEPATAAQVVPADPVVDPAAVDDAALTAEPGSGASTAPGAPRRRRDSDLEAKARQGELPPPPDFSAPTHARFRGKLEGLVALAERGDIEGLRVVAINPVSSSPKAMARYRDLCVIAVTARAQVAA